MKYVEKTEQWPLVGQELMLKTFRKFLRKYRFDIFLTSQIAVLFGSLLFSDKVFETTMQPLLVAFSIAAGINLIASNKKLM